MTGGVSNGGSAHLPYIKNKSGNIILFTSQNQGGGNNGSGSAGMSQQQMQMSQGGKPILSIASNSHGQNMYVKGNQGLDKFGFALSQGNAGTNNVRNSVQTFGINTPGGLLQNHHHSIDSVTGSGTTGGLLYAGKQQHNLHLQEQSIPGANIKSIQQYANHAHQYSGLSPSPNITGLTSNPVTKEILAQLSGGNNGKDYIQQSPLQHTNILSRHQPSLSGKSVSSPLGGVTNSITAQNLQDLKHRRIYVIDSTQDTMKSVSFNHDQSTSSGTGASMQNPSNLKGLFSQSSGIVAQGKRNSNLRHNLEGISNTTNGINKDYNYHRSHFVQDKFSPVSELTPKIGQGGAYAGILEAKGGINGSQMSIFSNDMMLARVTNSKLQLNASKQNEHYANDTPSSNLKKEPGNLLGNKKSSIDVSAMMEKIQSYKISGSPIAAGGVVPNNPTTGDNFQIQARLRSFNNRLKSDQDETALMHITDDSFRKANQAANLLTKLPGVRVNSTNQSSRVASNTQVNLQQKDRTSSQYQNQQANMITAMVEGSSMVPQIQASTQKPRRQIGSKERLKRNMNRKHMIHQRIKCQGIPVVGNSSQPYLSSENSTHFGGFPKQQSTILSSGSVDKSLTNNLTSATDALEEFAQSLANLPNRSIFDHEESLKMIQNYSSLLMKDQKFRDNILLAGAAQSGTPYIQYLIKNNKTKQVLEQTGHTGVKNNAILEELEYSLNKLKAAAEADAKLGHGRSQTSLDKYDEDTLISGSQDGNEISRSKQSSAMKGTHADYKSVMQEQASPMKEGKISHRSLEHQRQAVANALDMSINTSKLNSSALQNSIQKTQIKFIQSMKRYASKERFLKLLDQIAATAMKESVELDPNSDDFQQRLREASNWLIQEQLKQRLAQDKLNKNFHLKGTQAFGQRQSATPNYGDKRVYNKETGLQQMPMKIQQLARVDQGGDETFDEEKKKQNSITPAKKFVTTKAPLIPAKPKVRLDNLLQLTPIVINMGDVNELFHQINRLLTLTIKHKDTFSNIHIQEIKYQAVSLGLKLNNQDLQLSFLKSNAFISMLRAKISSLVNRFIIPSFPAPCGIASLGKIIQRQMNDAAANGSGNFNVSSKSVFKFWVENSGNNHPLVKQIFKRRNWLIWASEYTPPAYGSTGLPQEICIKRYEKDAIAHEDDEADIRQQSQGGPHLIWTQLRRVKILRELTLDQIYNHIDGINLIATKTNLFLTLKKYYEEKGMNIYDAVPETYLINVEYKQGQGMNTEKDKQLEEFARIAGNHIWILKPGENTNRGHGIQIFNDVRKIINSINHEYFGQYKTVILQKYIPNPYLISRRKFDFRVYALLTYNYIPQLGGPPIKLLRGYFYEEGYLRTSSKEFTLKSIHNKYVHLTNDAVQKYSQDYGKFENGNKISYEDFKTLLMKERGVDFYEVILTQIKQRIKETFEAAGSNLIGEVRYDYNGFELMGFDFMLDDDLKLYMIECNTNPCLETAQSILLQRLIPTVLDQTCKLAVDPFLRANEQQYANASEISLTEFKYEMVYEQRLEHFPPKGKSATNDKGKADPVNVATIDEEEELPPGETQQMDNADQPEEDMIVDNTDDFPEEGQ